MTLWIICALALIVACVVALLCRKWRLAQDSVDANGIDRLTKVGSDLSQAHAIEFLFYFPVRAAADGASARLNANGYKVSVEEDSTGTRCVLRATRSMIPHLPDLQALRSTLDELASREGGLYDGWKAEVVR